MSDMYKYLLIFISIGAILSIFNILVKNIAGSFPYRKKNVLSKAELSFMEILKKCLPENFMLLAKVRLWDIIETTATNDRQKYINKISSKHVDFLICNMSGEPKLVIELDDSSHNTAKRKERDEFVNGALTAAGIKIIHQQNKYNYNISELCKNINDALFMTGESKN